MGHFYKPVQQMYSQKLSLDDDPENINGEVSYAMPVLRFKSKTKNDRFNLDSCFLLKSHVCVQSICEY